MHYNSFKSRYLRVMLLSLVFLMTAGQAMANINLRGDFNGWSDNANEFKESGGYWYTTAFNFYGSFKVYDDGKWYSLNGQQQVGNEFDIYTDNQNTSLNQSGNLVFRYNKNSNPRKLYVFTSNTYYIKHKTSESDETWTWEELTANGNGTYSVDAVYGGGGCNWNIYPTDGNSQWIQSPSTDGNPQVGDICTFSFNPANGSITIAKKKVATPSFSLEGGTYDAAQNVTIACTTEGATIYYTTDGSTPTTSSTQYTAAIKVGNGTTTLKAIAVKSGMNNSEVAEATYTVNFPKMIPANDLRIVGTLNGWNARAAVMTAVEGGYSYSTTLEAGDYQFKVVNGEELTTGNDWSTASTIATGIETALNYHYEANTTFSVPTAGTVTFFVNNTEYNENDGSGLKITVTVPEPVVTHTVKISGGLNINGDWTTTDKSLENKDGIFTYTFTAVSGINKYFRVKVDDKFIGGNTTSLQLNNPVEYYENAAENFEFHISSTVNLVNGTEYTVVINTNNKTICINGTGHAANEIPVYPRGVHSETELAVYNFEHNPVIYLLAEVLNHERVSPEWQMNLGADGKYHLDGFAMRSTNCHTGTGESTEEKYVFVRKYTALDTKSDLGTTTVDEGNVHLSEGELYNATFDPENNTLTLTKAGGHMPFISLVGNAMKQDQNYDTPRGSKSDHGWAEGWLQYDENGKILKDRNGNVMYSTMWPPRNPVYFTANIGGERTYSSEQMTFKAQNNYVAKTGAEWKELLQAGENGSAYNNLGTGDYELKDNVEYVRYVVPDIWYVGAAKVWTGWTGRSNNNNDAQWSNHANWGYGDKELGNGGDKGTTVVPEMPYYMSTTKGYNGNFYFENPTYFKTIEFFYNTSNRDESRLYTTLAFGKAQIEAQSHKEGDGTYNYGMYKPSVSPDQGVSVLNYTIRCYDAATGKLVTLNDGIVAQGEGDPSSLEFRNDALGLAEGKYYYELEVTFQTANGERTSVVKSNPFIIYFPGVYTVEPVALQVVGVKNNDNTYTYVTYNKNTENAPLFTMSINDDNELTAVAPVAEGERAALFTKFESNTGIDWTDKVLVVAPVPAQFKLDAEKADAKVSIDNIVNYTLNSAPVAKAVDGSMAYLDNSGMFTDKVYTAAMNYKETVEGVVSDKTSAAKPTSALMMRPNPLAGGEATVTVEKIENSENIVVDGIEVATDYYKVCVELPFNNANVTNASDQPAYLVSAGGTEKLYTSTTGDKAVTIAAIHPTQTNEVTVTALYKDAHGQYTLAANIGDELSLTAGDAMFTPGKRKIDMFEIAKVKVKPLNSDDPLYYDNYITKLGVVDEDYDKLPGRRLEPKYYKFEVTLNDDVVPFDQYFKKVFYNVQDITNFDVNNDAMYVSRTPRTQEISSASISISPVYPVLVNATVGAKGMEVTNGVASAPTLKAETATYVALFGAAAEKEYTLNGGIVTGIDGVDASKAVQSVRFVNVAGQMSDKPFEGMNIVVTTYTDGTTVTAKVIK